MDSEHETLLRHLRIHQRRFFTVDEAGTISFDSHCSNPHADATTSSLGDHFSESDAERVRSAVSQVLAHGHPFEMVVNEQYLALRRLTEAKVSLAWSTLPHQPTRDEEHFRSAIGAFGVGLWSWDLKTDTVTWNDRMHQLTGSHEPLTLPRWIELLVHPDDRAEKRARHREPLRGGPIAPVITRIIHRVTGDERHIMVAGRTLTDASGTPYRVVGGALDVSDQQRVNTQLEEARRMETLGHLTAGVAHNFNNMLMIIAACLENLAEEAPEALRLDIEDATVASTRATEIVAQLMSMAGQLNSHARVRRPAEQLCREMAQLARRSLPKNIVFDLQIDSSLWIETATGAMEQVLSNLINNARDALVESKVTSPRICLEVNELTEFDERWIQIMVRDNGPGIPPHIRKNLFEPFVTSKQGRGTGLGLASSQAIVQQHGGQLACRSSSGQGTEFMILLPPANAQPQESR